MIVVTHSDAVAERGRCGAEAGSWKDCGISEIWYAIEKPEIIEP